MKYLSNYTQGAQTSLFIEKGVFFAFSKEQFEEQKQEWIKYTNFNWMNYPKEELQNVLSMLDNIQEKWIKLDIEENWIDNMIKRELSNYECYYTWDITDVVVFLSQYSITREQVRKIYLKELKNNTDI